MIARDLRHCHCDFGIFIALLVKRQGATGASIATIHTADITVRFVTVGEILARSAGLPAASLHRARIETQRPCDINRVIPPALSVSPPAIV